MIEATSYKKNYEEILSEIDANEQDVEKVKNFYSKLIEKLKQELDRIRNLRENDSFTVINYLKRSFKFVWEKYLLMISILVELKKENEFKSHEIDIIKTSAVHTHLKYMERNGYIQKIGTDKGNNIYLITKKGLEKVKLIKGAVKLNQIDIISEYERLLNEKRTNNN